MNLLPQQLILPQISIYGFMLLSTVPSINITAIVKRDLISVKLSFKFNNFAKIYQVVLLEATFVLLLFGWM